MNKIILLCFSVVVISACADMDIAPPSMISEADIFSTKEGVTTYMARMYSELPIEDFKYSMQNGFNNSTLYRNVASHTGEAISRDVSGSDGETFTPPWGGAYALIREANFLLENFPKYAVNFTETERNQYMGEAYFIRAYTYFALVKRFGGVPLVDKVLDYPLIALEETQLPRASEEEIWDLIAADCDLAAQNLPSTSGSGQANKYVALALKSRTMLFAGSIAKYNTITLNDQNTGKRVCGVPESRANDYFQQAYNAAKALEGVYSLYYDDWKDGDRQAQYKNYVNLFNTDTKKSEYIFVKYYIYPDVYHLYDNFCISRQQMRSGGSGSEVCPTLNFVELFDGIAKNQDGTFQTLDAKGHYILWDDPMQAFANVEPRLRATVILPMDEFKGETIEIRRGIWTGEVTNGIDRLIPEGWTGTYQAYHPNPPSGFLLTTSNEADRATTNAGRGLVNGAYTCANGEKMIPAGLSGTVDVLLGIYDTKSGFLIRKYMDENLAKEDLGKCDQGWIDMRYAEVLLNRAEAAYELYSAGVSGTDWQADALACINDIRKRAGANLLANKSELNNVTIIRNERRKELAFEHKVWWDMKRWRTADVEQNSTVYRVLWPFYADKADKYFFDARLDERNTRYTYDSRWYYQQIPTSDITKNPNLIQNPGF
ncbi:MAG: RagB/SusD family nutrient uptake outer membrane protein [Dysgonamonadaceae bacterium]|nr:RagB/SusD family nutrient uptake outer membrane protein [Dysgonamonadaceae bacterium]